MELIKINQSHFGDETVATVNARDLHEFLGVKSRFAEWVKNRIRDFNFVENQDFTAFSENLENGGRQKEYALCLNMAKELSMVERNAKGKEARQYFIECERVAKQPPQLNDPAFLRDTLLTYTERVIELESRIEEQQPQIEAFDRIANAEGSLNITEAAKALQMRPKSLFEYLSMNGWIYKRAGAKSWLGYQSKVTAAYLHHKVTTMIVDGDERINEQVRVTPKGLTRLAQLIPTVAQAA